VLEKINLGAKTMVFIIGWGGVCHRLVIDAID
jgi:hypothetical protein